MKKILLTAAVLTAFTTARAQAQTDPFEFKVTGFLTWYAGFSNQNDNVYMAGAKSDQFPVLPAGDPAAGAYPLIGYDKASLITNAEVDFVGSYTFDENTKLSFFMGLDIIREDVNIDLSYLMLDSAAGRFIVGNSKNVANMMAVKAPNVSTLGLQDTDYFNMVALPYGFAINPATYSIADNDTAKASYITPQMNGWTLGFTVMPSDSGLSPVDAFYVAQKTRFEYGANAAVLFEHDFGSYQLSVGAHYSFTKPTFDGVAWNTAGVEEKNIHQYGGGINVGFGNWSVGGSAMAVNTSDEIGQHMHIGGRSLAKGVAWDAGVSYTAGPFAVGLNVIQSRANSFFQEGKKDIYTLYLLSFNYKVIKGVEWFTETGYVDFNAAMREKYYSNNSPLFVTGVTIKF